MGLKKCNVKGEYRSPKDNIIQEFYIPLLSEATSYKRAVGFFSSSALVDISKGITNVAKNHGKIQIVASPYLYEEDIDAIKTGYLNRDKVIENALLRQLLSEHTDYYSSERLNLLAHLIADNILDIRIAYIENINGIGMYHEKMGIIQDKESNKVAFSGSMNATKTAMTLNYETIDVFHNWGEENDAKRVEAKEEAFNSIWNNLEPNIQIKEFQNISQALIDKYKKKPPNFNIDEEQFSSDIRVIHDLAKEKDDVYIYNKETTPQMPKDITLYDYQEEAISAWVGENYRGIYDMATGTGKTLTALGSIVKISEDINDELAVIIVCPFQHLVEQWVEDIFKFNIEPIIGYSNSTQKDWKKRLKKAILNQNTRYEKRFFCFICTNATFKSTYVQNQISNIKKPMLLIVDEAHNFGSKSYAKLLDNRFQYKLALSATFERHRDEEGTEILFDFFGRKCIKYSLERAIYEGKLTPYKYYPVVVYLNDDELNDYNEISYEMSKHLVADKSGKVKLDLYGELLAIERSRIVAGASEKLNTLRNVMDTYKDDNNILVYCGATNVIDETADVSNVDEKDIRQINAVTKILGNELEMKVAQFTSRETMTDRATIKKQFEGGEQLQVLVAIKCLDEGVNIPGIKTAFILASTTNPKEYIQRRGRVLRRSPKKEFAEIYDFVTLPRPLKSVSSLTAEQAKRDLSLVKKEIDRIEEFGKLSLNSMDAFCLVDDIKDVYNIIK